MARFILVAVLFLGFLRGDVSPAQTTELFFSEYIEGSSNNKALEIFNGTGATVDLATGGYNIQMFFNGSTTAGLTISLTGTVADGDVYVAAHSSSAAAILAQADLTNGSGWYNGDDAVVLRKGTTIIDVIGQIGLDPGTEWGSGLTSTADNTLRRKSTVCGGDTEGSDAFDPAPDWDGYATDTFDGLGSHTANCALPGTVIIRKQTDPASSGVDFSFIDSHSLTTSVSGIGPYDAEGANFGPPLDVTGLAGMLELADPALGCSPLIGFTPGKIAVIDRGTCLFTVKILNAQNAGAIAVIVINNVAGPPIVMGGTDVGITIPAIMISQTAGLALTTALASNPSMLATLSSQLAGNFRLQHGGSRTISNVPAGSYTLEESDPFFLGYEVTSIMFTDPDNGSSANLATRTATIDVDAGETVEVTYTNSFTNERCQLSPQTDSKTVNTLYTLTYTFTRNGVPQPSTIVEFSVVSGPNTGESANTLTDVDGKATFSYIGDGGTGTDIISVLVTGIFTCEAEVTWTAVCPRSQGYWKNHLTEWPASALPMMLGTVSYTQAQLLAILNKPVTTDASLILAHQLIAAKLNIAAGAATPAPVPATITAADAAIGGAAIPMKTKPNTTAGRTMTSLASTLDAYNNGSLNTGCTALPKGAQNSNVVSSIPEAFVLEQNYPNPFNPTTTIEYALPVDARVTLEVYDVLGRRVVELVNSYVPAGYHYAEFNAANLASGVYFYRLAATGSEGKTFTQMRKLILMK